MARIPLAFRAALLAALVPLLCAILAATVVTTRLPLEEARVAGTAAQISATWLADRLALRDKAADRAALLRLAGDRLGAEAGLYDSGGTPVGGSRLGELAPATRDELWAGRAVWRSLAGEDHVLAAAPVRLPGAERHLVIAVAGPTRARGTLLLQLIVTTLFLVLVAGAFGMAHGADLAASLERLSARLAQMIRRGDRVPATPMAVLVDDEVTELFVATDRLQRRFRGELALYRDAREEVDALNEQRSAFFREVSAELSSPLAAINDRTDQLLAGSERELSKAQADDIQIISKAGRRLSGLLDEILDFSAISSGALTLEQEPVSLAQIATEVVETARGQVGDKQLELVLEIADPEPPLVLGDRRRLWQVVSNLVGNALKFTERGTIRVVLSSAEGGSVEMAVIDTGVGIPHGDQAGIFEPFGQRGETARRKRGTGLGLAICRRLIEHHGGTIGVKSAVGEGSRFHLTLPGVDG